MKGARQKTQKVNESNETDRGRETVRNKMVKGHKASGDNQRS